MIDKVLGMQPAVRRKRPDNTSQTSSNKAANNLTGTTPTKQVKKLYQQEPIEQPNPSGQQAEVTSKTKQVTRKNNGRPQKKTTESEQEIASPLIRNIKMAKVPLTVQDMKNSTKIHLQQSAKKMEMRNSQIFKNGPQQQQDPYYKWKILAFLIISFGMVLFAMTPNRKAPGRRS